MEPGHHPDPLEEALSHGSQRVAQLASITGAMAQVVLQRRTLHQAKAGTRDQRATRILRDQERLIHQQARMGWTPAHDPAWLANAGLLHTARAWASAASHADTGPAAASAMRKCEGRLRALHPYAMTRYDELRADGVNPLDAMHQTAPYFSRHPGTRVGDPAPAHPAIAAAPADTRQNIDPAAGHAASDATEPESQPDPSQQAELRARQIIARLQSGARAAGRPELGADELAMILETTTNLPGDIIDKLTSQAAAEARARSEDHLAGNAERARAADLDSAVDLAATATADERTIGLTGAQRDTGLADSARAHASADRSAAQLAALSFPRTATDAVRAATGARTHRASPNPVLIHKPEITEPLSQSR